MRLRDSLILLAILVALVGVFWWINRDTSGGAEAEPQEVELYRIPNDQLERIVLTREGEEMVLERQDGAWQVSYQGRTDAGDQNRLSSNSLALGAVVAERVLEEDAADLEQYGLEDPRIQILVEGAGRTGTVLIGIQNPVANVAYARQPDSRTVYLINPSWAQVVEGLFANPPFPQPTPTPTVEGGDDPAATPGSSPAAGASPTPDTATPEASPSPGASPRAAETPGPAPVRSPTAAATPSPTPG